MLPRGDDDFEDARNGRNGFHLSKSPSHLLRRCVQRANDLFLREPQATDLTKQQFMVLAAVEQNEGVSRTRSDHGYGSVDDRRDDRPHDREGTARQEAYRN